MRSKPIRWVPEVPLPEDDVVVWVKVAALDAAWSHDFSYYVGRGGRGPTPDSLGKYQRFGEWFTNRMGPIKMPDIGSDGGVVSFVNGRHRFAWLRDHGATALPVSTAREEGAEVRRRFGSSQRTTKLVASRNHVRSAQRSPRPVPPHRRRLEQARFELPKGVVVIDPDQLWR